jgi:hypothetical protein
VFDAAATGAISSSTPNAATATITGANDFLVSAMNWSGSLTGVSSPYGNFVESNGNGTAANINSAVGTGAHFTPTTAGSGPDFTIAFKETGGGAAAPKRLTLLGAGD